MFVMMLVRDTLAVRAARQGEKDRVGMLMDEVNIKYANKVITNQGLCIGCAEIAHAGPARLVQGQSEMYITLTFRLIMFRPFDGEILLGKVLQSDATGFIVSLGFFAHVFVPADQLPYERAEEEDEPPISRCLYERDSSVDDNKFTWFWEYRNPERKGEPITRLTVDVDDVVRVRLLQTKYAVQDVLHAPDKPKAKTLAGLSPAMLIIGSINEDGLGPLSWWNAEEEEEEQEEEGGEEGEEEGTEGGEGGEGGEEG
eukprot:gb/GEZN01010892.1/.p1 GENE.gb/GEZN01010892.1/~~gb/GEZN01010892.1/.p1  ORF type:complete len:256 (-),score=56.35 gb/GEZN01010892.1/:254-1021(-)